VGDGDEEGGGGGVGTRRGGTTAASGGGTESRVRIWGDSSLPTIEDVVVAVVKRYGEATVALPRP
jgi:hypothetical protein